MRRTGSNIHQYLKGIRLGNKRLRQENARLRTENQELLSETAKMRKSIEVLESSIEDRISKTVEEAVTRATAPLYKTIAENEKEILRLRTQLGKDSSNSSKPSGSNGLKKVPNKREKSGKRQGGQHGHKGVRLNIPENLDELVANGTAEHVIISDVEDGEAYVSDWTIDFKVVTVYTEHRRKYGMPPKIEYGPQLKAIAVYLSVIGLVAVKRLSQFFREISHNLLTVSKATLAEFNHKTAESVEPGQYVHDLLNGKVVHVDETPIKTSERANLDGKIETAEKTTFNAYIRTYSNETTTILTANPFKTEKSVITDNILTQFHGIISQDHESKFYNFGDLHATCGAHLTRELKGLSELQMPGWAAKVRLFFLEMNRRKNDDIHRNKTSCDPALLCSFETRYDELVHSGKHHLVTMSPKSFGYGELRRMVNRLDKHKDNYLLFIRNYDAPFTNNQAERDLRHCKTKQKVSGCFRSWQGVLDYCKIRSLRATAKKRGQNLLDTLSCGLSLYIPAGQ